MKSHTVPAQLDFDLRLLTLFWNNASSGMGRQDTPAELDQLSSFNQHVALSVLYTLHTIYYHMTRMDKRSLK